MEENKKYALMRGIILVIWLAVLLITLEGLGKRIKELEKEVNTLKYEKVELWKNIDALSEDYTQLYQEIYKEVE